MGKSPSTRTSLRPSPYQKMGNGSSAEGMLTQRYRTQMTPTPTIQDDGNVPSPIPNSHLTPSVYSTESSGRSSTHTLSGDNRAKKLTVGVDYGTTFTSAAYHIGTLDDDDGIEPRISDIKTIKNWPGDPAKGLSEQVPSESWYSAVPIDRSEPWNQFDDVKYDEPTESQSSAANQSREQGDNNSDDSYSDEPGFSRPDSDESKEYLWGFAVPYQMYTANTSRNPGRRISRPKLMLIDAPYTSDERKRLRKQVNSLIRCRLIRKFGKRRRPDVRDVQDVISDFLTKILEHIKQQLIIFEDFANDWPIEFVISVPAIWSPESSRVLQAAMEAAIRETKFGTLADGSIDRLFIMAEPEAAATYLVGTSRTILAGETVMSVDAGGGTVDVVTHGIKDSYPLRLGSEIVEPGGDACGGSYANQNYHDLLLERLKDEKYLEDNGESLWSIVNYCIPEFENYDKRIKDVTKDPCNKIRISGLIGDKRRALSGLEPLGFEDNHILLNPSHYEEIFIPLLRRMGALIENQICRAHENGKAVTTVFLIGGFGAAPSVRSWIKQYLIRVQQRLRLAYRIRLIEDSKKCVTAVASGSVFRALDKGNGPERFPQSSYGFLRNEPFEPALFPSHKTTTAIHDSVDWDWYVKVINYVIVRGNRVNPQHEYPPLLLYHTFEDDGRPWICEERLYVHDTATESHFPLTNPRNKGARCVGRIVFDMSELRGRIELAKLEEDEDGNIRGRPHYKIAFDLVVIVDGRDLLYEARWPPKPRGEGGEVLYTEVLQEVRGKGQVNIAAAFKPGTG